MCNVEKNVIAKAKHLFNEESFLKIRILVGTLGVETNSQLFYRGNREKRLG